MTIQSVEHPGELLQGDTYMLKDKVFVAIEGAAARLLGANPHLQFVMRPLRLAHTRGHVSREILLTHRCGHTRREVERRSRHVAPNGITDTRQCSLNVLGSVSASQILQPVRVESKLASGW